MTYKWLFLDFDGTINTIYFDKNGKNTLGHGKKVNNWQAICLLNELFKKVPYAIIVTSTWRLGRSMEELEEILHNSGLSKDIPIIGKIPYVTKGHMFIKLFGHHFSYHITRGREIDLWLKNLSTPSKKDFIILDDDSDMWKYKKHLVKCTQAGFTINEYMECLRRWS